MVGRTVGCWASWFGVVVRYCGLVLWFNVWRRRSTGGMGGGCGWMGV